MGSDERNDAIAIEDFGVARLGDDLILATYDAVLVSAGRVSARSRRSSIWLRRAGTWRMRFNQGTRVPTDNEEPG